MTFFLFGGYQGSAQLKMPDLRDGSGDYDLSESAAHIQRNAYTPYGSQRDFDPDGSAGTASANPLTIERGWLSQVADEATSSLGSGLTYLNARYYDPAASRFISPDPLLDVMDPKTLDPYRYAENNPVMSTDATGLCVHGVDHPVYNGSDWDIPCNDGHSSKKTYPTRDDLMRECYAQNRMNCEKRTQKQWNCELHGDCKKPNGELIKCTWDVCGLNDGMTGQEFLTAIYEFVIGEDIEGCFGGESGFWGTTGYCSMLLLDVLPFGKFAGTGVKLVFKGGKWVLEGLRAGTKLTDAGVLIAKRVEDATKASRRACEVLSFSGDTEILMADGTHKPIKDIKPGDVVWAVDPETGEAGPRKVTHIWPHEDDLVEFTIGDDTVTTTEDHPFWNATDHVWQGPELFEPGDMVLTADGQLLATDGLVADSWTYGAAYNLTVDDLHTYFVAVGDGADVLVHNCPPGIDPGAVHGKVRGASRNVEIEMVLEDGDLYFEGESLVRVLANGNGTNSVVIRNVAGTQQTVIESLTDSALAERLASGRWLDPSN